MRTCRVPYRRPALRQPYGTVDGRHEDGSTVWMHGDRFVQHPEVHDVSREPRAPDPAVKSIADAPEAVGPCHKPIGGGSVNPMSRTGHQWADLSGCVRIPDFSDIPAI